MTRLKLRHAGLALLGAAGLCAASVLALFVAGIVAGLVSNYHPAKTIEVVRYVNRSASTAAPGAELAPKAVNPGDDRAH
jgi:hypothetical protein